MSKFIVTKELAEAMATQLISIKSRQEFFFLVGKQFEYVTSIPNNKRYHIFKIEKTNKSSRTIQDPNPDLKNLQRALLRYFQCLYNQIMPECSHGFVQSVQGLPKRNILSNALNHLNKPYLINLDIDSFFPSIKSNFLSNIFSKPPFQFQPELINVLIDLCTYQGHLPTGAPTSPVLSNFVALSLDNKLSSLCAEFGITYTRFVDDMSFSSNQEINEDVYNLIISTIKEEGFALNETKIKKFSPTDTKEVTGLVLRDKPDVSPQFLSDLQLSIDEYCTIRRYKNYMFSPSEKETKYSTYHYHKLQESIEGGLNFLRQIRGPKDTDYKRMKEQMTIHYLDNTHLMKGYYKMAF